MRWHGLVGAALPATDGAVGVSVLFWTARSAVRCCFPRFVSLYIFLCRARCISVVQLWPVCGSVLCVCLSLSMCVCVCLSLLRRSVQHIVRAHMSQPGAQVLFLGTDFRSDDALGAGGMLAGALDCGWPVAARLCAPPLCPGQNHTASAANMDFPPTIHMGCPPTSRPYSPRVVAFNTRLPSRWPTSPSWSA